MQVVGEPLPSGDDNRRAIVEALGLAEGVDALFVGRNRVDIMAEV